MEFDTLYNSPLFSVKGTEEFNTPITVELNDPSSIRITQDDDVICTDIQTLRKIVKLADKYLRELKP